MEGLANLEKKAFIMAGARMALGFGKKVLGLGGATKGQVFGANLKLGAGMTTVGGGASVAKDVTNKMANSSIPNSNLPGVPNNTGKAVKDIQNNGWANGLANQGMV